jgi:hypothetical protein
VPQIHSASFTVGKLGAHYVPDNLEGKQQEYFDWQLEIKKKQLEDQRQIELLQEELKNLAARDTAIKNRRLVVNRLIAAAAVCVLAGLVYFF